MAKWCIGIVLTAILTGCGGSNTAQQTTTAAESATATQAAIDLVCATETTVYADAIRVIAQEWDDATKLAFQTGRGMLSAQIAQLQDIKRDARAVTVPTCAGTAQTYLIKSMDATIDGFLAFMSKKDQAIIDVYFKDANASMSAFRYELENATK